MSIEVLQKLVPHWNENGTSMPESWKWRTPKKESPADEMQRLIRQIGGKAIAGEKDDQLRARAARRLNAELPPKQQIGPRRAKAYWYSEIADVPSHHMDRARELGFVQPIEEAFNAIETAEQFLDNLRQRLLDRAVLGSGDRRPEHHHGADQPGADVPAAGGQSRENPSAVLGVLNSLGHLTVV